ncbi:MAG: cytochrome c [Myxococcota bacterium]|nr:cytochrome c [Myxococcota bacterium]
MERSDVCARSVRGAEPRGRTSSRNCRPHPAPEAAARPAVATLVGPLLLLVLALACGGEAPAPSEPASTATAPSAKPGEPTSSAPATEKSAVPAGNLRGNPELGAPLYAMYCATCHGPEGRGDGPIAQTLVPRPADHGSAEYMGTLSDAEIYVVIEKGGAAVGKSALMAPWGGILNDSDIRDVIAHLRSLSGT